jgi:hypothetical protein
MRCVGVEQKIKTICKKAEAEGREMPWFFSATLTQPAGDDLADRVETLQFYERSFKAKMRDQGRRACRSVWGVISGGVDGFEFTDGQFHSHWHFHCHLLLIVERPSELIARFGSVEAFCTAFKLDWVDHCSKVRRDKAGKLKAEPQLCSFDAQYCKKIEGTMKDILEVAKYPTPFAELKAEKIIEAAEVFFTRSTKMFSAFGCMRGVEIDPDVRKEGERARVREYLHRLFTLQYVEGEYVETGLPIVMEGKGNVDSARAEAAIQIEPVGTQSGEAVGQDPAADLRSDLASREDGHSLDAGRSSVARDSLTSRRSRRIRESEQARERYRQRRADADTDGDDRKTIRRPRRLSPGQLSALSPHDRKGESGIETLCLTKLPAPDWWPKPSEQGNEPINPDSLHACRDW